MYFSNLSKILISLSELTWNIVAEAILNSIKFETIGFVYTITCAN